MNTRKTTVPLRSDIAQQHRWQLEHLFAHQNDWDASYDEAKKMIARASDFHDRLGDTQALRSCFEWEDALGMRVERLYAYAHMRLHENMDDAQSQARADRASTLSVSASEATSFIVPELLSLPTEQLHQFRADASMRAYTHTLDEIIRQKDHMLSKKEESLLAKLGNVAHAPSKVFSILNNTEIAFPTLRDANGNEVPLTHSRYIEFLEQPDRTIRRNAFEAMYGTYANIKNTMATTLHAHVSKNVVYARIRSFPTVLEASLHADNIPVSVYDQLIATIHEHLPLLHKYLNVRKRLLKLDTLHMYDLFAPLSHAPDQSIPLETAKTIIAEALLPMGEDYVALLRKGYDDGWIDAYENKGKRSGAYSWGAYGTHPYVLLNHKNNIHSMFTLAHEMGHALHSYLSDEAQPYRTAQYPIFLAEVASTLNETLLMEHLLRKTTDPKARIALLAHYADSFRTTVFRQTMFAEFERAIHEKCEADETLTAQVLSDTYLALNKTYYGNDVVVDEDIKYEWARIPHFYSSFYVYKYATGFSAAAALAQAILHEGAPAVARTRALLRSGGSDYPNALLTRAGVDMSTPAPIREAMRVFERIVEEMEAYAPEA